ncbi:MAG: chemotaxis protein CheW [Lachnospiraceae bacterium]|nr:chemotaxis protein CheW [Lachnospiraceae bacterium]
MSKIQVIFKVGRGSYSFDSQYVRAVEVKPDIRLLPGAPECILGLVDLRGELVPVCDLNIKFNTGAASGSSADVIFVNTADGCLGCTVDRVVEIGAVTEDLEIELPYLIRNANTEYIDEIVSYKGDLVTAIHQDRILNAEEKAALKKVFDKAKKKAEKDAEKAAKEAAKAAEEAQKAADGENA